MYILGSALSSLVFSYEFILCCSHEARVMEDTGLPGSPEKTTTTLKVHLPNGGFNVIKYGEAIDIKVIFIL